MYEFSGKLKLWAIGFMVVGAVGIIAGFISAPKTVEEVKEKTAETTKKEETTEETPAPIEHIETPKPAATQELKIIGKIDLPNKKEVTVEERLRALYDLQLIDSRVDEIRNVRGELPLEVRDLEDEVRIWAQHEDISELVKELAKLSDDRKELLNSPLQETLEQQLGHLLKEKAYNGYVILNTNGSVLSSDKTDVIGKKMNSKLVEYVQDRVTRFS